jgi:hypothetical protein
MSDLILPQSGSELANSASSQAETKETFSLTKSSAFALLQATLNIFKEVAGKTAVPGLQEGVKALVILLDVMQVCPLFKYVNPHLICPPRKHHKTLPTWNHLLNV